MARSRDDERLVEDIARFATDPLGFVHYAFPWSEPGHELADLNGPRVWQSAVLGELGDRLRRCYGGDGWAPMQIARASGHGIGKSALAGWIVLWALSTMADTRVVVTANTDTQLRTKSWPEVLKWLRLSINRSWFVPTATSIYSADQARERLWRADAIPWSETNTEAFAGLHNRGRRIVLIFDEASAIADRIWEVAEGALTDEDTEIIWLAFGNPTRNTGRFRECFGRFRHRWDCAHIDSRSVEGTNKAQLDQWVHDYGEDSDFVRVRVRGQFPHAGSMQFIAAEMVEAAMRREGDLYSYSSGAHIPLVMGVDVGRFGDDRTVIRFRRGRDARTIPPIKLRGVDTMTVAARVADEYSRHQAAAIHVDGGGVGGGVVDRLRQMRVPVTEVQFGSKADRVVVAGNNGAGVLYANKRAEMWGTMRDWLPQGVLDEDPELHADLTGVEYGYTMRDGADALILERKEDMKRRGLASPDDGDALALTFAYPVMETSLTPQRRRAEVDYDPHARWHRDPESDRYDPSARWRYDSVNERYDPSARWRYH
jgi:hypothetical protein